MSLESYVTGLMKEPAPKGMDRLVQAGLSQLEKYIFSGRKEEGGGYGRCGLRPCTRDQCR